ncbi:hypothetical protein [Candidatus Mycobacterium methanotrophicum]|uniref:Uncharacterized protein n=1 Tax=Candidatus Mycobacterium methanotrophicum TaxID=2943498 RepID=A0ABY4QMX9_9MYCO|nr:hypothetical protein [Candidatus Mycobacterium methanotrophicum]UQX11311.1 hypothetical protein M5I08_01860 [Candidatus Mycobacterium methanotrophicum]
MKSLLNERHLHEYLTFIVVFPAPLMSTIAELGTFLARENGAAAAPEPQPQPPMPVPAALANGTSAGGRP